MTDPAQNPDPLAALEEVLKNSNSSSADSSPPAAPAPDPAAVEVKQREELKTLETQHQQTDAQQLKTQIEDLHQLTKDAPKHVSESDQATAAQTAQSADAKGYEIRQLDHTKIQGNS